MDGYGRLKNKHTRSTQIDPAVLATRSCNEIPDEDDDFPNNLLPQELS